jgi:hypothetical protein
MRSRCARVPVSDGKSHPDFFQSQGEELISALGQEKAVKEWRRCCERVYKHILVDCAEKEGEAGVSWIITDSRCNLHLTSSECFERPVRLPAAMKGVKQAAGNIHIVDSVSDKYLELAERDIILRAHKKSYIQRIKKRCLAATSESVVALTEDSDGNGGEDTSKSFTFCWISIKFCSCLMANPITIRCTQRVQKAVGKLPLLPWELLCREPM